MAKSYPTMKYSKDESVVVNSAEEEAALKGKYYDSPADVPEMQEVVKASGDTSGYVEAAPLRGGPAGSRPLPAAVGPGNTYRDRLNYQAEGKGLYADPAWTDDELAWYILTWTGQPSPLPRASDNAPKPDAKEDDAKASKKKSDYTGNTLV